MKYEISFLEEADLDIEETYIWYETLSLGYYIFIDIQTVGKDVFRNKIYE